MYIKSPPRLQSAWTLVELMVGLGVFSLSGLAIATIFVFCIRSFAAMENYAVLDQKNRKTMDFISKEIRQAKAVVDWDSTGKSFLKITNSDNILVTYAFDAKAQQLTRDYGAPHPEVLFSNCNYLVFDLFTRSRSANSWRDFAVPINQPNWQESAKLVQMTWKTSMSICPTARVTSEDIQTAKVVIRRLDNEED